MYEEKLKELLTLHGKLSVDAGALSATDDLYAVGLTSLTTVNLMLAIEDEFDVEFEDSMLSRKTFQSVDALCDALEQLA